MFTLTNLNLRRENSVDLNRYPLSELKAIYQILHRRFLDEPEWMDSLFLADLQVFLQVGAKNDHVDIGDHAQWQAWLELQ